MMSRDGMVYSELIPKIEELVNQMSCNVQKTVHFDDRLKEEIARILPVCTDELPSAFAIRMMQEKGYCHKDGRPYHEKFYTHAWITQDAWNDFSKNRRKTSESTLLKIVIGLEMSEVEAAQFLSLAGYAFSPLNPIHQYLLACIRLKIYDPKLVYEILDFYIHAKPETFKGYRNIYNLPQ